MIEPDRLADWLEILWPFAAVVVVPAVTWYVVARFSGGDD